MRYVISKKKLRGTDNHSSSSWEWAEYYLSSPHLFSNNAIDLQERTCVSSGLLSSESDVKLNLPA